MDIETYSKQRIERVLLPKIKSCTTKNSLHGFSFDRLEISDTFSAIDTLTIIDVVFNLLDIPLQAELKERKIFLIFDSFVEFAHGFFVLKKLKSSFVLGTT